MACSRPWLHGLALLALTVCAAADDPPLAPDGRPGLGGARKARDYAEMFRAPTAEQRAALSEWLDLPTRIEVLAAALERAYKAAGSFRMLAEPRRGQLADLHGRYRELAADPLASARAAGPVGEAFARAFLDARFRIRLELLEAAHFEARDLRAGIALLRASMDGYVEFADTEARAIASRVDLSAALLRAIRLDLDALTETGARHLPGAADPAWVLELIGLAHEEDQEARAAGLAELEARVERVRARMETILFTPRLRGRLTMELRQRDTARERARAIAAEVLPLLPETSGSADPPPRIAALRKHERYGLALALARDGLGHDVLHEELAYHAGLATDFLHGRLQSRAWFDRYLALRGIRTHDHRTHARELSEQEHHALELVLSLPPLGR